MHQRIDAALKQHQIGPEAEHRVQTFMQAAKIDVILRAIRETDIKVGSSLAEGKILLGVKAENEDGRVTPRIEALPSP